MMLYLPGSPDPGDFYSFHCLPNIDSCPPFLYNTFVDKSSLQYPAPLTHPGGFSRPEPDPPPILDR